MLQDSLLAPRPLWTVEAFRALARHRFLTSRQLAVAIAQPAEVLDPGLHALAADGLLTRLGVSGDSAREAYTLARPGIAPPSPARGSRRLPASSRHERFHTPRTNWS